MPNVKLPRNTFTVTCAALALLAGCDTEQESAKKAGFESVEAMRQYQQRGYKTQASFEAAAAFTPDKFVKNCINVSRNEYARSCKDKRISWHALVVKSGENEMEVSVLNSTLMYPSEKYSVDLQIKKNAVWASRGSIISFDGIIGDRNFVKPDILETIVYKVSEDEHAGARADLEHQRKITAFSENHQNERWLRNTYGPKIEVACAPAVENLANYSFRWTEGFLSQKFPLLQVTNVNSGIIKAAGNTIEFQNGFGAWRRTTYICEYDINRDAAIKVIARGKSN